MLKLQHAVLTVVVCGAFLTRPVLSAPAGPEPGTDSVFTPAQEARIGEVASQYMQAHPEILVQISRKLQEQQQANRMKAMAAAVVQHRAELLDDKGTPSYGPADARVTVVEFFDYNCIYCARLAPELASVIKANPDVRFVFKEFPLFGQRWPASQRAAVTGLRVWQQKGAEAYLKYHNAVYATGHNEGQLTDEDISKAAESTKVDAGIAPDEQTLLNKTDTLAQQLGIRGTPAVFILPSTGASADDVTVIAGLTNAATLQAVIDKTAGKPQ